jgi:hypothetical protein
MIHTGVEKHVTEEAFLERRALHVLRQSPVTAPVKRHRPAAVRDDEAERRKVPEEIGGEELHEGRGIGIDIVRAGRVKIRVARGAHVHHGGHVELDHLLVEGIPVPVGERR